MDIIEGLAYIQKTAKSLLCKMFVSCLVNSSLCSSEYIIHFDENVYVTQFSQRKNFEFCKKNLKNS
jgi:hypothetical protein